jgi:hypothetical protein
MANGNFPSYSTPPSPGAQPKLTQTAPQQGMIPSRTCPAPQVQGSTYYGAIGANR